MRGIPLIRLAIVLALFLLALLPLWKLTAAKPVAGVESAASPPLPAALPTRIEITASQPVAHFTVLYLGQTIWEGNGAKTASTLNLPPGAFDLQIRADWPDGAGEKALRVRLLREDLPLADATFWGDREVDEVLTVSAN